MDFVFFFKTVQAYCSLYVREFKHQSQKQQKTQRTDLRLHSYTKSCLTKIILNSRCVSRLYMIMHKLVVCNDNSSTDCHVTIPSHACTSLCTKYPCNIYFQ